MASVDLSSINRAAMSAKEGYGWIHTLALAYCVIVGGFSVAAWFNDGEPFRAAVCAGAQVLSIIMALVARRGFTGQMTLSGIACVVIAFGFALWAAEGLAHAWSANGAEIEEWQVWFLTGSEPAIFLLIEHIKEGREAIRKAQEKAEREEAEALAVARLKDEQAAANRSKPSDQAVDSRPVGEGATIHRLRAVENDHQPDDQPGESSNQPADGRSSADQPVEELPQPVVPDHNQTTFADPAAHARHLITVENVRHRNELARRVRGLTPYRATQLLDELAPDWRTKKQASAA
jgi:hypothetical protein